MAVASLDLKVPNDRGVPQGAVLGPSFILPCGQQYKAIIVVDPNNGNIKCANNVTISVTVRRNCDPALSEVKNLESWAAQLGCL